MSVGEFPAQRIREYRESQGHFQSFRFFAEIEWMSIGKFPAQKKGQGIQEKHCAI